MPESPGEDAELQVGFTVAHQEAPYTVYAIETRYQFDSGLRQQPVGADDSGGPVEARFVRESAGCMQKVVTWTASRVYLKPVLPAPVPSSDNERLLTAEIVPEAPTPDANGAATKTYSVSGKYVFGLKVPLWFATDSLPMGGMPYLTEAASANYLSASDFVEGLI